MVGIEQCGPYECSKPKSHGVTIHSWYEPPPGPLSWTGNPIVGRIFSVEYQTPWQVNLIGPNSCGGTLISSNVSESFIGKQKLI